MVLRGELLEKPTYRVIRTIQEGNSGLCYKVWHEVFECWKIQKTVSLAGLGDALAYREPALLYDLDHRSLADVHEAQWDPDLGDKYVTFVMPYYEGGSLHSVLQSGYRFSLSEVVRICSQMCDALHYMHSVKLLLHRDVKPGNIFLSQDLQTAYLGDLGSAAPIIDGTAEFRGGTPLYRAPEFSQNRYVPQSDLYSFGMVILEMLNGPFDYASIDFDAVEKRLRLGKRALPARAFEVAPHVPASLRRIANGLVDPSLGRRPTSAFVVKRSLQDVVHLDWREIEVGDCRTWVGTAPPTRRGRPARNVEVTVRPARGRKNIGLLELRARWQFVDTEKWRNLAGVTTLATADDQASWRLFFKSVETAMLQSAARR